jgi:hypothetical protein
MSVLCALTGLVHLAHAVTSPPKALDEAEGGACDRSTAGLCLAIFAMALVRMCRWPLPWASWAWWALASRVAGMPAMASAAQVVHETGFAYTLSVIPLFILMGNFVARAGLAHELFHAAYTFIGHRAAAWRTPPSRPAPALAPSAARPSPPRPP